MAAARTAVAIRGELTWHGYLIPCRYCGGPPDGQWTLYLDEDPWVSGDDAWLSCPRDHRTDHPLIYPEVARWIIDHHGEAPQAGVQWVPHEKFVRDNDCPLPDEPTASIYYRRWGPGEPTVFSVRPRRPQWWRVTYPGLFEAGIHQWFMLRALSQPQIDAQHKELPSPWKLPSWMSPR